MSEKITGLALMRTPFAENQISKLPKPTKQQTEAVKNNFQVGIRCKLCGAWHHKDVVHLDYVGHAAVTDRLLECDPAWNWEPLSVDENGLPLIVNNSLWIKLTVCGVTRLGFGEAQGKQGGDAIKEIIGDALRNSAMRFGAALDLWHKGDLHIDDPDMQKEPVKRTPTKTIEDFEKEFLDCKTVSELASVWALVPKKFQAALLVQKDKAKIELDKKLLSTEAY